MESPQNNVETIFAKYDGELGFSDYHKYCLDKAPRKGEPFPETGLTLLDCLSEYTNSNVRFLIDREDTVLETLSFRMDFLGQILNFYIEDLIADYFGCEFMPAWMLFQKQMPGESHPSYKWHCDGGPSKHLKILLYLSDMEDDKGGTWVLPKKTTDKFKETGYVFCNISDRITDLSNLAEQNNIEYTPVLVKPEAGHALLFEPAHVLHMGIPSKRKPRYLAQICFVPSPVHWLEACEKYQRPHNNNAWPDVKEFM